MRNVSSRIVDLITTSTDRKFEPVARMADAIVDLTLRNGDCSALDLQANGFASSDVAALWHFAHLLAEVELKHLADKVVTFAQREVHYA